MVAKRSPIPRRDVVPDYPQRARVFTKLKAVTATLAKFNFADNCIPKYNLGTRVETGILFCNHAPGCSGET